MLHANCFGSNYPLKDKISAQDLIDNRVTTYWVRAIVNDIEKNPAVHVYGFNIQDVFLSFWMLLKVDLFSFLVHSKRNEKNNHVGLVEIIKLLPNWYQNNIKYKKTDFLFLSLPTANLYSKEGSYNIYHDDFAFELSSLGLQAVTLQLPHNGSYKNKAMKISGFGLNWTFFKKKWVKAFFSRLKKKKLSDDGAKFLKILESHLSKYMKDDVVRGLLDSLSTKLTHYLLTIKYDASIWQALFCGYQPRFVILPNVCEGGLFALASLIAKKNHAIVIEAQHSALCPNDFWFNNHSPQESLSYLPHYFWMYGGVWLDVVNLPLKKAIIGNPYYSKRTSNLSQNKKEFDFLLILDITSVENNKKIFQGMQNCSGKILVRPHPFDRHDYYVTLSKHERFFLDDDRDLWKSLALSKAVIIIGNYFSTVGYEALSVGLPVIFITDTKHEIPIIKELLSTIFVLDIQEKNILSRIFEYVQSENLSGKLESISTALYDPDWQSNLKDWVLSVEKSMDHLSNNWNCNEHSLHNPR